MALFAGLDRVSVVVELVSILFFIGVSLQIFCCQQTWAGYRCNLSRYVDVAEARMNAMLKEMGYE